MWFACHIVVQVLRSCQQCCWWIKCSGVWCCVAGWVVADIAEGHSAFICRVTLSGKIWRLSDPSKYWELCAWYTVSSQKTSLSVYLYVIITSRAGSSRSTAACLLRSWVRILPGAWMFVCCECCVLSGRGLCDGLITRPEESYRLWHVVVCDQETSHARML